MTYRALFATVLVLTLSVGARAQSLGEAAAREQKRRAQQSPGAPSYDDQDLQKGKPPSPSPSPSPSATPPPRATPAPGVTPPPIFRGGPRGPRNPPKPSPTPTPAAAASPSPSPAAPGAAATPPVVAATAAPTPTPPPPPPPASASAEDYWRARARSAREAVSNAERQVAELEARVNALRNDMAPTNAMQASREQQRQAALGQAIADLDQARAGLARARQSLEDLEEEARRKGALPGWLRER